MLWNYIVQISSAIKTVHSAGLACRNIELNRILTTRNDRLRLSGLGILDILQGKLVVDDQQKQDLICLGQLIITLACHSQTIANKDEAVAYMSRYYSKELNHFVSFLMDQETEKKIDDVLILIGSRILEEINHNHLYVNNSTVTF
jgi:PAB-dependent poly(A)-specific ribonuclease subunit 3